MSAKTLPARPLMGISREGRPLYRIERPASVVGFKDGMAIVCCYCPTKDIADGWAAQNGYPVTHGCCPPCLDRELKRIGLL